MNDQHDQQTHNQQEQLRAILKHAATHSAYYRDVVGRLRSPDIALPALPVTTKKTLLEQFDRIVTDPRLSLAQAERHLASEQAAEPLFGEYRVFASGGTTGQRAIAIYDQAAWSFMVDSLRGILALQGIHPDTRFVGIGSPTPLHVTHRLFPEIRSPGTQAPRLNVTTPLPQVVDALNAYQPEIVMTYPSFIRRLAEEQVAGRLRIKPRQLSSTAETLTANVRELALSTWGASVLNIYGATEVGLIGAECHETRGLHVAQDRIIVEVVDEENRPVPAGVAGHKLLVTTLFNRVLPLIRYEFSDLVTLAEGPCPCGRQGLRLAAIQGRREDMLTMPARNGGRVGVHVFHLEGPLLRIPAVRQFQITPQPTGLLVRVVLRQAERVNDVVQFVARTLESELERVGAVVKGLTVEAVSDIARTGTGAKEKLVLLQQ